MQFTPLDIPGVWEIEPKVFGDSRGSFSETYRKDLFEAHIGKVDFIQENESVSVYGVVRGLHLQKGDKAQAKLVRVTEGEVLDVAVDLRKDSPTYGEHVSRILSAENHRQLFIPKGFAHGFAVLSLRAKFQYKVDAPYCPEAEMTIDCKSLPIDWKVPEDKRIFSQKDLKGIPFNKLTNS